MTQWLLLQAFDLPARSLSASQMASASAAFITGTLLLAQVAPYLAVRTKQESLDRIQNAEKEGLQGGPELFDLHAELLNSKTFHLEGLDHHFGRCCCDKDELPGLPQRGLFCFVLIV